MIYTKRFKHYCSHVSTNRSVTPTRASRDYARMLNNQTKSIFSPFKFCSIHPRDQFTHRFFAIKNESQYKRYSIFFSHRKSSSYKTTESEIATEIRLAIINNASCININSIYCMLTVLVSSFSSTAS